MPSVVPRVQQKLKKIKMCDGATRIIGSMTVRTPESKKSV